MIKRLILAAVCMVTLPLMFSPSTGDKPANSAPFATVAYAGHTVHGDYCQCGCFACICDQGEEMGTCGQSSQAVSDETGETGSVASPADSSLDFGSGALFVALALFALSRFRLNLF